MHTFQIFQSILSIFPPAGFLLALVCRFTACFNFANKPRTLSSKMPSTSCFLIFAVVACLILPALSLNNGLGKVPQMGWNSWYGSLLFICIIIFLTPSRNHFHCNISEGLIRQTADAIVSTGLKQSGYIYVVGFCLGLWFRFYST